MSDSALHELELTQVAERLRGGELSPVEVTQATLARIERLEPSLHAFAEVLPERALAKAQQAEREIAQGDWRGPLHGVPIGVKDLCAMRDVRTASGTLVFASYVPNFDATVVERLEQAGAIVIGKTQLTEGAFGWHHPSITEPVNPWHAQYWTGVSSSGSGVATAAGLCFGALGSDTGGSIRFPSSCCGVTGLKPTYGRVSRFGVFPLAHSLDHIGPMARSAADAAALLQVLAGHDGRDPTSLGERVPDYSALLGMPLHGVSIGLDRRYVTEGVADEVSRSLFAALEVWRGLGAVVREIEMPPLAELVDGWVVTTAVECLMAHTPTFPAQADKYGPDLRSLLELGQQVSGVQYARLAQARAEFTARLNEVLERVDVILTPAMPTPTPTKVEIEAGATPAGMASLLQFTAPFDYSGHPTITLPVDFVPPGVPLGAQLIGGHCEEARLLQVAAAYQAVTDWHRRRPPL